MRGKYNYIMKYNNLVMLYQVIMSNYSASE